MACKEEKKVMVYYLGELSDHESSDFQSHLQTCMTCQNVLTELEDTHHLLNLRPSIRSPKNLAKACMHHGYFRSLFLFCDGLLWWLYFVVAY